MEQSLRSIWNMLALPRSFSRSLRPCTRYISWTFKCYSLFTTSVLRTQCVQCVSKAMSKWKGKTYVHCTVCWIAKFSFYKIEYVNLNTNQPNNRSVCLFLFFHVVLFLFSFFRLFMLFLFRLAHSIYLYLVRCQCFRSFSLLQFNFKAKTCYHRTFICIIHIIHIYHITLYDSSSKID